MKNILIPVLGLAVIAGLSGCSSGAGSDAGSINYSPEPESSVTSAPSDAVTESDTVEEEPTEDRPVKSEAEIQFTSKLDDMRASAHDYLIMHSTERAEKVINPSLNGNTQGVGLLQTFALGAEPSLQSFDPESGSFNLHLMSQGKNVMTVVGYFIPESQQINVTSVKTSDAYTELLQNNMDEVSTWSTS